jgi:hypothetical protein
MMRVDDRANRAVHPLCRLRTDKIFPRFVFIDDKMPVARCGSIISSIQEKTLPVG